jgi:hypothetical protein
MDAGARVISRSTDWEGKSPCPACDGTIHHAARGAMVAPPAVFQTFMLTRASIFLIWELMSAVSFDHESTANYLDKIML